MPVTKRKPDLTQLESILNLPDIFLMYDKWVEYCTDRQLTEEETTMVLDRLATPKQKKLRDKFITALKGNKVSQLPLSIMLVECLAADFRHGALHIKHQLCQIEKAFPRLRELGGDVVDKFGDWEVSLVVTRDSE